MTAHQILRQLRSHANPRGTLGVSIPILRQLAKQIGRDHTLARQLWATGIHEARLLAGFIAEPAKLTSRQMDAWARDFDSWDICDQVCSNLFDQTPFAYRKAVTWSHRREEFVKRAGYVLMAALAVHDKQPGNEVFEKFLPHIVHGALDERNFVKKAVNWALRQIGKRNRHLRRQAVRTARQIQRLHSQPARWIAADALRELTRL
jgi:3-methyladenine DNA glycosylase AlkD